MLTGYRFEMIVGCMRSGKSSELIRRIERARLAYLPTIIVRPATDTRSKPNQIESRNGLQSRAIVVETARDILKYSSHAVVIGMDECQFFSSDVPDVVQALLRQKKKIIASGLDLDYRGKPFGPIPELLAMADRVDKLLAVCRKCGSDFACRTQRMVNSNEQILVGDAQYEARCLSCFEPPSEYQLKLELESEIHPEVPHLLDCNPDDADSPIGEVLPLLNINSF
ncbi:MAG: thymidine kinase [Candidatus Melainabacteria bacterium]|jgi:thymidine kinase|nr:thymidine kinase [Candidatus Melainabacteria bacterium]